MSKDTYFKNEYEGAYCRTENDGTSVSTYIKPFGKPEYEAKGDSLKYWYEITQGGEPVTRSQYEKGTE